MSLLRWKQKLFADGGVARGGDGGGGGSAPAPQPTNTTVQNTNIPEYARPYVETMLGTAQQQIFNYDDQGNVTSMKGYTPYSNNPTDYIAGFSPLQQQAQSNIANMQTPGQYGTGTDFATTSGLGALSTANTGAGYGNMGANAGLAGMAQGMSYGQNATNPNAVAAYMNPYLQNALNPSLQLQAQQFGQLNAQNQGQATQQGAFGGGRQAVMQGLNQQNEMLAQNQLVGNAYNQAYNTANQNMQNAANLGMQGTAQAMQGAGIGLQGTAAQQAAYQQLGAQGANLANIAGQQTQSQLGINAAQQASGAAQQAQQQNIINQQVQNYATAQQYPMMQLANMSNLLRGLPMQSATTQTYQAAPSAVSQLGGLGATALGAYGAAGGFKGAKGGLPKDFEKVKKFDVGGSVKAQLYQLAETPEGLIKLQQEAKSSPSAEIRQDAAMILAEKQMEDRAVSGGVGAATSGMQLAGGGIVAFANRGLVDPPYKEGEVGNGPGEAFSADEMYAGSNRATPLPPVAGQGPMSPALKSGISWLDQLKSMGYGQSSEEDKAIRDDIKAQRAELKANQDQNLWRGLMMGGAKAMASKSPWGGVGIGEGIGAGVEEYGRGTKDLNDQLAKLRTGELDLSKINSTDRNTLLHYALTGATSERDAELRAEATRENARLRASQVGGANADRLQSKLLSIAKDLYATDIKANTDPNGIVKLTAEQQDELYRKALQRASTMVQDINVAGGKGGDKGGKGGAGGKGSANAADFDNKG